MHPIFMLLFVVPTFAVDKDHDPKETTTAKEVGASVLPYPADIRSCPFLKREKGYHFLAKDWQFSQTGLDLFRKHPLVKHTDYSQSKVAILDTGLNVAKNPKAGQRLKGAASDKVKDDDHGHGTHVAGTTASKAFGVNPRLQIVPYQLGMENHDAFSSSIVNSLIEVGKNPEIKVVNLSMSSMEDPLIREQVLALAKQGVWIVYASGNDGEKNNDASAMLRELSEVPELFSVGALNYFGTLASFSNYGPNVDFYAPGVRINSLNASYDPKTKRSKPKAVMSGTSMAAPYASGVLATLRAIDPKMTPEELKALIKETSLLRGTKDVIEQINPLLMVTYLHVIGKARASGECSGIVACLPLAKRAVQAEVAKLEKDLEPPPGNDCKSWERFHERLRRGYFLSRGQNPAFSGPLVRIALGAGKGDAAESVYYQSRESQPAFLDDYRTAHGGVLAERELKAAKSFHEKGIPAEPISFNSSKEELEVSLGNLDTIWKRCESHFFNKPEQGFCASMLEGAPRGFRLALAKRLVDAKRPLVSASFLIRDLNLKADPEGHLLHKALLPLLIEGLPTQPPDSYGLQTLSYELPSLSLTDRKKFAVLLRDCVAKVALDNGGATCKELLEVSRAYTEPDLSSADMLELEKALLEDSELTPSEAKVELHLHRLRAGFLDFKAAESTLRELFASLKEVDGKFTKWELSNGLSGRGHLFAKLEEMAGDPRLAEVLGRLLSNPSTLKQASEMFTAKRNGLEVPWESVFSKLIRTMKPEARKAFLKEVPETWMPKEEDHGKRFYDFLEANQNLPEVAEVIAKLKTKEQPSEFWKETRLRYLRRTIDEAKGPVPELVEFLNESPGQKTNALRTISKELAVRDPAFLVELGKIGEEVSKKDSKLDGDEMLSWIGLHSPFGSAAKATAIGDKTAPVLVPNLAGILKARRSWGYDNGTLSSVGMTLRTWMQGKPERAAQALDQFGAFIQDSDFMSASAVDEGDSRRIESNYRRKDTFLALSALTTESGGEAYLAEHPAMLAWMVKQATDSEVDYYLKHVAYSKPLMKELRAKFPEKPPEKGAAGLPNWMLSVAAQDPRSADRAIRYLKASPGSDMRDALKSLVLSHPDKLTYEQKREIDALVGSVKDTDTSDSSEGVWK